MDDFDYLEKKTWCLKPDIEKDKYELVRERDQYGGIIYSYIESDSACKERVKNKIKKNLNKGEF